MKNISFALFVLFSAQTLFPINLAEQMEEIRILEQKAKSQYIYSWFVLGGASFVAAKFLGNYAAILEQELKEKWFFNPETGQEELPADTDQTSYSVCYWANKAAVFTGVVSLIWGVKQSIYTIGLHALIKIKQYELDQAQAEHAEQEEHYKQQSDPGFQRWRQKNRYGSYGQYRAEEATNAFYEAFDAGFRQWRKANPDGSYAEYSAGGGSYAGFGGSSSSGTSSKPQPAKPAAPLKTHYETLGVDPKASNGQIKKVYFTLARENHPSTTGNMNLDPEERAARETHFKNITDAYDTLKDPTLKAIYDRNWSFTSEAQRRANVAQAVQFQENTRRQEAEAEAKKKRAL